jgi:hypothetical protein
LLVILAPQLFDLSSIYRSEVIAAMKSRSMLIALLGIGGLIAPAFAADPARPGTVNYVEGAAFIEGQPVDSKQIGSTTLEAGQELSTAKGKAEILLTPGVFLRVDSDSTVKLISPDLTLTQVELEKGKAAVEVDEIHDQNDLQIIDAGVTTRLDKTGYYEFDANKPEAMVFKGMAKAEVADGKWREIKGHHELMLTGEGGEALAKEKPADFSTDDAENNDQLYRWSKLRSQYLAEANNEIAGDYYGEDAYPGWYWDPGWGYTFIGGGPFYSPFGWGFYPLGWGGWGWGGGWYGGWRGRGYYGQHGAYREGHALAGGNRGGVSGFHGGEAGGFHGGMGGGGFHGGGGGHR